VIGEKKMNKGLRFWDIILDFLFWVSVMLNFIIAIASLLNIIGVSVETQIHGLVLSIYLFIIKVALKEER
jgi:hypothetical protein